MRCYLSVLCVVSALVAVSLAAPMPQSDQPDLSKQTTQIVNTFNEKVSLLRRYCPQLFQVIDNVIQNVTSTAFRVIGRVLLQNGGLGGGSASTSGGSGAGRVSVVLPDFGDDDDDEDDEDETAAATSAPGGGSSSTSSTSSAVEEASNAASSSVSVDVTTTTTSTTTESSASVVTSSSVSSIDMTSTATAAVVDDRKNDVDNDERGDVEVKIEDGRNATTPLFLGGTDLKDQVTQETPSSAPLYTSPASINLVDVNDIRVRNRRATDDDQSVAASGGGGGNSVAAAAEAPAPNPADDLANVEDDADRDKRFLPFGGSVSGSAGSGGGSGNFLFDIIRRSADGAARAAGTIFRLIAGTATEATAAEAAIDTGGADPGNGLGFGASYVSNRYQLAPQLIAGSGATEASDEADHSPLGAGGVAEIDVAKATDAYTEGVPGPITRLFVLANRGLANLVQDLILRLAQTSERIVNFKARLVTALI